MINMIESVWEDRQTGENYIIFDLCSFNDEDLVWFQDMETLDKHCMSVDMFVARYKANGVFERAESTY